MTWPAPVAGVNAVEGDRIIVGEDWWTAQMYRYPGPPATPDRLVAFWRHHNDMRWEADRLIAAAQCRRPWEMSRELAADYRRWAKEHP